MGWRPQRQGIVRTRERKRPNEGDSPPESATGWRRQGTERKRPREGHSPLETAEGGLHKDMTRKRPSKALVQMHRGAGMSETFREDWGAHIPAVVQVYKPTVMPTSQRREWPCWCFRSFSGLRFYNLP